MDSLATIPLANPAAVAVSGNYYIKALGANSCTSTKPVKVTVLIYKLVAVSGIQLLRQRQIQLHNYLQEILVTVMYGRRR
jgi:hypothetical protein